MQPMKHVKGGRPHAVIYWWVWVVQDVKTTAELFVPHAIILLGVCAVQGINAAREPKWSESQLIPGNLSET